jgi:uncharacterized protein
MNPFRVTLLSALVIAATALAPTVWAQLPDPSNTAFDHGTIPIDPDDPMVSVPPRTDDPTGNVAVIRGAYASFARGDIDAVLSILDDHVMWTDAEGFPYAGTYRGPDSVASNVFARIGSEWDAYEVRPARFIAQGSYVVVLGEYRGTYRATGKSVTAPFAHVWQFVDRRVASFRQFTDGPPWQRAIAIDDL